LLKRRAEKIWAFAVDFGFFTGGHVGAESVDFAVVLTIERAEECAMPTDVATLHAKIDGLIAAVSAEGVAEADAWNCEGDRPGFADSGLNLAHYLALRRRDLRALQPSLAALGLSSLGRLEGRVLPTLMAVRKALSALLGHEPEAGPSASAFFAGETRLAAHTHELFGASAASPPVALLVTCPSEAADGPDFMLALATRGVEAVRINCAHDDAGAWARMIGHLRAAEAATGRRMKVFMDLAGPKIRTGEVRTPARSARVHKDELIAIARLGELDAIDCGDRFFAVECTLPQALVSAKIGDRVYIDDGKLQAKVERIAAWGLLVRVTAAGEKGLKLKPEKGLNFPDCELEIEALTVKDRADLAFVAVHADGVEFSFVQSAADVVMLQDALAGHRPADWRTMSLILKIETARAVTNLPAIIVQAARRQPTAIMIARGDLAVEIGFARTAEMQEEILWLGEACDVPVIWATQVLEHLVSKGTPSRGEMTDAAMAARAECVMLNKGPYLLDAIDQIQALLRRMDDNQHKKTPRLRRLKSW
jgi:pyruvate kinase